MSRIKMLESQLHAAILAGDATKVQELHQAITQELEEL